MLLDLKILNGDMPLKFDKYVNNYTVEIAEDVTKLEIDYECNEGDLVNILNNDNLDYGVIIKKICIVWKFIRKKLILFLLKLIQPKILSLSTKILKLAHLSLFL